MTAADEWSEGDILMSAAEAVASDLFTQADDDTLYHHCIHDVRYALAHGQCSHSPEEIAECILAWSGALN